MTSDEGTRRLLVDIAAVEVCPCCLNGVNFAPESCRECHGTGRKPLPSDNGNLGMGPDAPAVVTGQGDYRREWPKQPVAPVSPLSEDMTRIRQRKVDTAAALDALADLSKQVADVIGSLGRGVKYTTSSGVYPHDLKYLERDYLAAIAAVRKVVSE